MSIKTMFLSSALVVVTVLLSGCTNIARFDYTDAPGPMVQFPEARERKSIAVMPFLDQRGMEIINLGDRPQHIYSDSGSLYWGLLPLFPFGFVQKKLPEQSNDFVSLGYFHFDPANDLAAASIESLKYSNLFSWVGKTNSLKQAETDYIWQGTITDLGYRGKLFSYCITYFLSPALWIIGAPSGVSHNQLGIDFALVERATGETVWKHSYHGNDYIMHWIYARVGDDTSLYAALMKQAMNQALYNLSKTDLNKRTEADINKKIISREEAISIALKANIMKYDKSGNIEVLLKEGIYTVILPVNLPPNSVGPDFAAKVEIDAESGKVLSLIGS